MQRKRVIPSKVEGSRGVILRFHQVDGEPAFALSGCVTALARFGQNAALILRYLTTNADLRIRESVFSDDLTNQTPRKVSAKEQQGC